MCLHCVVHMLLLIYVVPCFGNVKDVKEDTVSYPELNKHVGCSWFSANPVNCLRAAHFYGHSPPCIFYSTGREHLLQVNENIGCFFHTKREGDAEDPRDFQVGHLLKDEAAGALK